MLLVVVFGGGFVFGCGGFGCGVVYYVLIVDLDWDGCDFGFGV